MDDTIKKSIEDDIKNNKVMVYMKGTPAFPQCGFSGQVATILKSYNVDFTSKNVLEDDELRQAIKEFSDWPTIPQIYINGELVGGCDIIAEMHNNGELKSLLGKI